MESYSHVKNVEIAAVCDVDENVIAKRLATCRRWGWRSLQRSRTCASCWKTNPFDAVSIATPNHWHSLMTIWACQAGKDVYVEKPCSHNLWEGRQLVKAAEKYGRIVQHGTQSRSAKAMLKAQRRLGDDEANQLPREVGRGYRAPFVIPEQA
ncbi:MAG TPA: Gfo/Idh/MocA family oxidoreductase [Terriglobia bacterium]|nr:Gfo/Idh/MocA family oxidoreductase [Terriglobia bacterium]